jgi:hypothetical protein
MDIHIFLSFFPPPLVKTWQNELRHVKTSKADGFFFSGTFDLFLWHCPACQELQGEGTMREG